MPKMVWTLVGKNSGNSSRDGPVHRAKETCRAERSQFNFKLRPVTNPDSKILASSTYVAHYFMIVK